MGSADSHALRRSLSSRHITLIAVGGAIGTGLFVGTGASIASAGPGGALLSYAVIGVAVYFIMSALGEMVTHRPVAGSFERYSGDYVEPAMGFMVGWMYWYSCAMTIAVELVAASIIMKFWLPDSPSALWSGVFLVILLLLNAVSARVYGEAEFWFAGIKVLAIIVFLLVGVLMIVGIMGGTSPGFRNWTTGGAPFVGGATGTFAILMVAGFSFIGVESAAVAAGEAKDPRRTMPRAINSVFWRILLFYVGAIVIVATLIPYTDPNLLKAAEDNVAASPFTLVLQRAGLAAAASVMNAIILTSVLSAGNSALFVASRLLHSMAHDGRAPRFLGRTSGRGVPLWGVVLTLAVSCLAFLSSTVGDSVVYTWLYNATGLSGFIVWAAICIAQIRFRAARRRQGLPDSDLQFRARWYPWGTWFALIVCIAVIIGQGVSLTLTDGFSVQGMLVAYIGLPVAAALWLGWKITRRSHVLPLADVPLDNSDAELGAHDEEKADAVPGTGLRP